MYFVGMSTWLSAQQKSFWKEDFSSGALPQGWVIVDSTGAEGRTYEWFVTDQPYPGSFQFDQQAPPIASVSRGYHMQYRAGVFTGEEVTKWNQRKEYPSGYFQTSAINCEGKNDIVLKFQHAFRWNNWFTAKNKGLWVGVSNDGKNWKEVERFEFGNLINDPSKRYHHFKQTVKARYVQVEAAEIAARTEAAALAGIDIF